jgi:pyruvate kinase
MERRTKIVATIGPPHAIRGAFGMVEAAWTSRG